MFTYFVMKKKRKKKGVDQKEKSKVDIILISLFLCGDHDAHEKGNSSFSPRVIEMTSVFSHEMGTFQISLLIANTC